MTILFFTNISPFPANGGEKIRSYYLLKALSQLGHKVVAVICNEENVNLANYGINNVIFYTHPKKPLTIMERITWKHLFQQDAGIIRLFEEICRKYRIDAALLDYGTIGQYISFFTGRQIPVIMGTHNAQAMITQQVPAKSLFQKLRKFQLVNLEKLHERLYFKHAAATLVVSDQDRRYHERFLKKGKVFVVPNFLDETEYTLVNKKQPKVLVMTANFGVYMNYTGLKWFIEEVWDDALAAKFDLWLVGRNSKEALQQITGSEQWKNIVALGKVDDVKWYISVASGVIIPLLHGSGTRLKCLEAMALRTPIISTAKGVEGVVSNNFIIADSAAGLKTAIMEFNSSTHTGEALREDFMKEYSAEVNRRRLDNIINYAVNGRGTEVISEPAISVEQ
jgi:glycosyltransferase involved in cell wall biosynthesis